LTASLPEVRVIQSVANHCISIDESLFDSWKQAKRRMIIVGQQPRNEALQKLLEEMVCTKNCVLLTEPLSNLSSTSFITNFDPLLEHISEEWQTDLAPDLLITLGGHLVSKNLKKWLRHHKPTIHWHLSEAFPWADTYQSMTLGMTAKPVSWFSSFLTGAENEPADDYVNQWHKLSRLVSVPSEELPFSDLTVCQAFLNHLPEGATLLVSNSSPVRHFQLFGLPDKIEVYCNRGTNGIEGTLATAAGLSLGAKQITAVLTGDLSFFHDIGSLWQVPFSPLLRIVLINNGGGGIFHLLPDLTCSEEALPSITAVHHRSARHWIEAAGLIYLKSHDTESLQQGLTTLFDPLLPRAAVLEVMTDISATKEALHSYHSSLNQLLNYVKPTKLDADSLL
jgi:2-succinyl-5-enolpyruvyl-6-hydroxy-3-cyclohexene-1-carboxylate synthase